MEFKGRKISKGVAEGEVMVSSEPISFYGGVDPETGKISEEGHPLNGKCISGKVLVFPRGKGSTVGSYALYRLKKGGKAPVAIVNKECETIVAVGAIISEIPLIDKLEEGGYEQLKEGEIAKVDGNLGVLTTGLKKEE